MNNVGRLIWLQSEPVTVVKTATGYEIYGSDDSNGMPLYQGDDLFAALELFAALKAAACDGDGRILIESVYREDED